ICIARERCSLADPSGADFKLRFEIGDACLDFSDMKLRAEGGEVCVVDTLTERINVVAHFRLRLRQLCTLERAPWAKRRVEDPLLGVEPGVVCIVRRRWRTLSVGK